MRLTLLSHFIGRGGSTAFFIQIRDFMASRGHQVSLVVGRDAPDPMAEQYQVVPFQPNQRWRDRMREYVRVIQATQPDAVYTTSGQEEFEVLRFLKCPRALHCLCIEQHEYSDLPLWHRQLQPYTELRTANTPDLLERVKGTPPHRIQLACAPYRLPEVFLRAPDVKPSRPGPARDAIEVCFLGRLDKFQKRVHWLPEIMSRCQSQGVRIRWHIYGSGPAEPELRDGIAKAGLGDEVKFHGWQGPELLAATLGAHDLFFLCSRWEGLPAAMVEAMLCGLACVVPNCPAGMTYMLEKGGGRVYEAESPAAAAAALAEAATDPIRLARWRSEAQAIARALNAREVVDGQLGHVADLLEKLPFNGNAADLNSARPMKLVTLPVLLRRRWTHLKNRLWRSNP
ncbi:MAG: glycosyltransferase [Verrucomicrobiota bacterium]